MLSNQSSILVYVIDPLPLLIGLEILSYISFFLLLSLKFFFCYSFFFHCHVIVGWIGNICFLVSNLFPIYCSLSIYSNWFWIWVFNTSHNTIILTCTLGHFHTHICHRIPLFGYVRKPWSLLIIFGIRWWI